VLVASLNIKVKKQGEHLSSKINKVGAEEE